MKDNTPRKLEPIRKQYIWGTEDWMLSDLHKGIDSSPLLVKIITAKKIYQYRFIREMIMLEKMRTVVAKQRCGMCWTVNREHFYIMD